MPFHIHLLESVLLEIVFLIENWHKIDIFYSENAYFFYSENGVVFQPDWKS